MLKKDIALRLCILLVFTGIFTGALFFILRNTYSGPEPIKSTQNKFSEIVNPLSIAAQRAKPYPGSNIVIEEELPNGSNYKQYITSYMSDGLKIFGLLTVPTTEKPAGGYPVIIFNHGYIPPTEYRTTEKYLAYIDTFAKNGYVVFKSDYRGHGSSEGKPTGAYFSPSYTTDVLNALASVKKLDYVNKNKIGMWGHSMGGTITQKVLVIDPNIQAAVIWGGVVGSYEDIYRDWWSKRNRPSPSISPSELNTNPSSRQAFIKQFGEPNMANEFWNAISSTSFLNFQKTPVSLHHGLTDETVPHKLSSDYYEKLKIAKIPVEIFYYEGNDHNISQSFNLAIQRSVDFFDKYLK